MTNLKTLISATISGALVATISLVLPWALSFAWLASLLILTGGIYIGIAIMDRRNHAVWLESMQAIVIMAMIVVAWAVHPLFLGLAWLIHPVWDLLHHSPVFAKTPTFVIHWCLVFDVIVGIVALVLAFMAWT